MCEAATRSDHDDLSSLLLLLLLQLDLDKPETLVESKENGFMSLSIFAAC